ncbi:MAG TPA: DUF2283 domain-containing protein [Candidatus Nanoarchaeia archaeon]|nr:hypothetical protein [uncultured archaeon]
MNVRYDPKADAAYIYLTDKKTSVAETKELSDEVFVDYDKDGRPLGIEIIGVKDRVPSKTLHFFETQTS